MGFLARFWELTNLSIVGLAQLREALARAVPAVQGAEWAPVTAGLQGSVRAVGH